MTYAVLSSKAPCDIVDALNQLGYTCLLLPPFERLSTPVDTHADMLLFSYKNYVVTHRDYYTVARDIFDILDTHCGIEIILSDDDIRRDYPHDIAYNATVIGGVLYSNTEHTSKAIKALADKLSIPKKSTKQGYTACSTLIPTDRHAITADPSLSAEYESNGIDICRITNGSVSLPPYDCGFIGGASGVCRDTVYFAGDINYHSDASLILSAIKKCKMNAVSLSKRPLLDIGGIKFFDSTNQ